MNKNGRVLSICNSLYTASGCVRLILYLESNVKKLSDEGTSLNTYIFVYVEI